MAIEAGSLPACSVFASAFSVGLRAFLLTLLFCSVPQFSRAEWLQLPTVPGENPGVVSAGPGAQPFQAGAGVTTSLGATYYVDNVNGNDSNNGTSASSPFQTVAKINSLHLAPGQTVAFRAGQEWHEMLTVSSSGAQGSPITFTSYGSGAYPILSAADTALQWSPDGGVSGQESCTSPAFCSGFENAGFSDWSGFSNSNDASLSIVTNIVHTGTSSMLLTSTNGVDTRAWVTKQFAPASSGTTYAFRFYMYVPTQSLRPFNNVRILELFANGQSVGFAFINTDGAGNISSVALWDSKDANYVIAPTLLKNFTMGAWNELELDFTTGAQTSGGSLYCNGALQQGTALPQVNTGSWVSLNQLAFGNTAWGSAIGAGSTVYLDDMKFTSYGAPIGVLVGQPASNVWSHVQAGDPKLINFAGQAGTLVAGADNITAANQYAWDGSTLTVYSTTNPANSVEIPQRPSAVTSAGASYVTFSNLEFRGAQAYDVYCGYSNQSCDHWIFQNDTFNASYSNELFFQPYPGTAASGPTVQNSLFKGGGAAGIALSGPGSTSANIVNNTFTDLGRIYAPGSSQNMYSDAIVGYSATGVDGTGTYIGYNTIQNIGLGQNQNYGGGIHADTVNGWIIEFNTVQNTTGAGIQIEKGSNHTVSRNLIVNGGLFAYNSGLMVRAGDGVSIIHNVLYNNTSYGGWWACSVLVQQNSGPTTARGLIYQRNICDGSASNTNLYTDASLADVSNNVTANSFGAAHSYFVVLNNQAVNSYADLDSLFGLPMLSIQGDPLFTNPAAGAFTLQSTSPAIGLGAYPWAP